MRMTDQGVDDFDAPYRAKGYDVPPGTFSPAEMLAIGAFKRHVVENIQPVGFRWLFTNVGRDFFEVLLAADPLPPFAETTAFRSAVDKGFEPRPPFTIVVAPVGLAPDLPSEVDDWWI